MSDKQYPVEELELMVKRFTDLLLDEKTTITDAKVFAFFIRDDLSTYGRELYPAEVAEQIGLPLDEVTASLTKMCYSGYLIGGFSYRNPPCDKTSED